MGRAGRIAGCAVGAIVLLLALAQLFLPGIAASRISSRLSSYGRVQSVSVTAWPAVKLLWGSADSVRVRASELELSPAQSAKLLWEGRGASTLQMTAVGVKEGPLQLRHVELSKHGDALMAAALVTVADVKAALPRGFSVQLIGGAAGQVHVRGTGALFGVGASVQAVAAASKGKLVVRPLGLPLDALQLTLFADPHVYVERVGASALARVGGQPGYRLTLGASLR